jgi:hypothetical protein
MPVNVFLAPRCHRLVVKRAIALVVLVACGPKTAPSDSSDGGETSGTDVTTSGTSTTSAEDSTTTGGDPACPAPAPDEDFECDLVHQI